MQGLYGNNPQIFYYQDLFNNYHQFLEVMNKFAEETYRVLADGRIAVVNIDDMLVNGEKNPYPIY